MTRIANRQDLLGVIAQSGEHLLHRQGAMGSSPIDSTIFIIV
jgi:hypothetical protein